MLKEYLVNGKQYQYEEGEQPEDAVEVTAKPSEVTGVPVKEKKPSNKAGRVKTK
jgi:hypothetical protein